MNAPVSVQTYGGVPVPYTVSWSAEEGGFHLARCGWAGGLALCQAVAPGQGKPRFGKPHAQRQRQTIAMGLCDLCGKTLKGRTKVSLSHARSRMNGHKIGDVLQVEPLLHKECAAISMRHCPALRRDIANGTLRVRQVNRHAVQMAIMTAEYGDIIAGDHRRAIGHAKVQLLSWIDRDAAWLSEGFAHVSEPLAAVMPANPSEGAK